MAARTRIAFAVSAACGVLALLVYVLSFHTARGQAADVAALQGFLELGDTWVAGWANRIAHLCDPAPFAALSMAVTLMALLTRGIRGAVIVGAILLLPNVLTQELKPALAAPRPPAGDLVHVDAASWPSGHSTAAMALAVCAALAAPAVLRWFVAIAGALFAVVVGYAVVMLGWHFPSDVVGGFAVAGGFAALGVAALAPGPVPRGWSIALPASGVVVAGAFAMLVRVAVELDSTRQQVALLGVGLAIVALALAVTLAGAFSRPGARGVLRRRWPRGTG